MRISDRFPRYTDFDPLVPVWCVTPGEGRVIHRFFDTSPFSPSRRFLGLTRLPQEDRMPVPGELADVVLVDLESGDEHVVAQTAGWDTQLGAQVQWGATDAELFYNAVDLDTWRAYGVRVDVESGEEKQLDGPIYMVSPDGRWAASPCLLRTYLTQAGYGVLAPDEAIPRNRGAADDDGIYVTNTKTGECSLRISFAQIVDRARPALDLDRLEDGNFYAAHVKWSPDGSRLMLVLRWLPNGGGRMHPNLITMNADGTDVRVTIRSEDWIKGGHHPNWCPDGKRVLMNLKLDSENLRFVSADLDGSDLRPYTEETLGSGHPTLHPDGRHMVTDAYLNEPVAFEDGSVPIRWVDLETGEDQMLVRIQSAPEYRGPNSELRVDPHPAWDREFTHIAFNACPGGTRRVYVADLSSVI